jgi:hypothetical protein
VPVDYGATRLHLCPYFPGHSYCWTSWIASMALTVLDADHVRRRPCLVLPTPLL